jgi:glutathione S-transferase
MPKSLLRIFSYLPNPRIFKASITARLCNVPIEIRGASPKELKGWLWDFNAGPLAVKTSQDTLKSAQSASRGYSGTLYKTSDFLDANPYGTVPAAFSPSGEIGVFESNSIMRAVARLATEDKNLYGSSAYESSRIDSFLDSMLLFAKDSQAYLLALMNGTITNQEYIDAEQALHNWLTGTEQVLVKKPYLTGELSLADICFACEITLLKLESCYTSELSNLGKASLMADHTEKSFPSSMRHYEKLCAIPDFAADIKPFIEAIDSGISPYKIS